MENPYRWLRINVVVGGGCAAIAWLLYATLAPNGHGTWQDGFGVLFVCCTGFAILSLPFTALAVRKFERIRRGDGVLARWTVPTNEWNQFVANERALLGDTNVLSNLVDIDMAVPRAGIEIVVADDAIVVGSELHRISGIRVFGRSGLHRLESTPPTLQFAITMMDPDDTLVVRAIRFPVASHADALARGLVEL